MALPANKTKIICTIGPSSETAEIMEQMVRAGMDVARLNLSHGDFTGHQKVIGNLRRAATFVGRRVAILADLPGPKIRIGQIAKEPITLRSGDIFTLTTEEIQGDKNRVSVTLEQLPKAVKPGDTLFLNDGLIQLEVLKVQGREVSCRVVAGGELWSRKGVNLPGIKLDIPTFTDRDRQGLKFASENGIDAISQSFVQSGADIDVVRKAAADLNYNPYIIAKIERSSALENMDEILETADGIMIARGDLGVEIPIEQMAVVQKRLMRQANLLGKPIITATQMLESMMDNRRPTRAEATDVANAILDGTDCLMLSGESALGSYPIESVVMLTKIAAAIEPHRSVYCGGERLEEAKSNGKLNLPDLIARSVATTLDQASSAAVFVPTRSGYTARSIARSRLPVWIIAVSSQEMTCQRLQFSYGVYPVHEREHPENWNDYVRNWLLRQGIEERLVIVTEGPSHRHPETNNRMELIDLTRTGAISS